MIGGRSALLAAGAGLGYGNWTGNYSDVSLLLRNGTIGTGLVLLDESPRPKTITAFGNALVTTAVARWNQGSGGSSLAFDGSGGDYFWAPASAEFLFPGDHTIECWIYWDGTYVGPGGGGRNMYGTGGAGSLDQFGIFPGVGLIWGGVFNNVPANYPPINQWAHVAASRQGSTIRLFINGALTASGTQFASIGSSTAVAVVGTRLDDSHPFKGYIDDFRITKGVARYTSNFSSSLPAELPANATDDPHYSDVSLLLRNGTPALIPLDESPTPKELTVRGSARISTTVFKYGNDALVAGDSPGFSWGSSGLEIAPSLAFAYGTGDYTVEAWIYPTGLGNNTFNQGSIMFAQLTGGVNYFICAYRPGSTSSFVKFSHTWATSGEGVTAYSPDIPRNQWSHVAVVRSNGQVKVYGNGVSGSPVSNTQNFTNTTYPVLVGTAGTTTSQFEGYIDDLRVTKGVARYTKNFLPPPAELPAI